MPQMDTNILKQLKLLSKRELTLILEKLNITASSRANKNKLISMIISEYEKGNYIELDNLGENIIKESEKGDGSMEFGDFNDVAIAGVEDNKTEDATMDIVETDETTIDEAINDEENLDSILDMTVPGPVEDINTQEQLEEEAQEKGAQLEEKQTEVKQIDGNNYIVPLDLDCLEESPFNFFKPLSDKKFKELLDSIKANGLLEPIIARPSGDNKYEILSGHNRVRAFRELGYKSIPTRVMYVDDDKAREIIVDTNVVQRDQLSPLEIAKAYAEKARAIGKRQGQRADLYDDVEKGSTRDLVGKEFEVSGVTVERYMRLNNLMPEFQEMLENNEMNVKTGFELGLLDLVTQEHVLQVIEDDMTKLNPKNMKKIKKSLKEKNKLTKEQRKDLKENGIKPEYQALSSTEVKDLLNDDGEQKQKPITLNIKIPADYDKDTLDFIEGTVKQDPMWLIELLKNYVHGNLK